MFIAFLLALYSVYTFFYSAFYNFTIHLQVEAAASGLLFMHRATSRITIVIIRSNHQIFIRKFYSLFSLAINLFIMVILFSDKIAKSYQ